jgi:hypothetical protein
MAEGGNGTATSPYRLSYWQFFIRPWK